MTTSAQTIILKNRDELRIDEVVAAGTIKPGHLISIGSAGTAVVHAVKGGWAERMVAIEDALQGKTVAGAYSSTDRVSFLHALPGEELALRVASGQNVVIGEALMSAGDGSLMSAQKGGLLYSSTAESAEHENTTDEAIFDKSYTLPANFLKAGDVLHIVGQVTVNDNNSTDTLTLTLRIGGLSGTAVIATAAVDVADADVGFIDCYVAIRTIGAAGTFVATGTQGLGVPGTVTAKPFTKGSTAIDTTTAQVIAISADWSVAHADNEASLTSLIVELLRTDGPVVLAVAAEASGALAAETLVKCRML